MLSIVEMILFLVLLSMTFYLFFRAVILKIKLIKQGQPVSRYDRPVKRVMDGVFSLFLLTGSLKKERIFTGFFHFFILYGSLTFDTVTVAHMLEGFNINYHIGPVHSFIADIFAVLVLIAVAYFAIRRYIFRPKNYTYGTAESAIIYTFITTVTLTFLLYEGATIAANPARAEMSFFGQFFATFIPGTETSIHVFWWIHILNVLAFVSYVPYSKYIHMFSGPINTGFQNYEPKAKLNPLDIEDEEAESFGIEKYQDFNWKDILDGFACIDCGRCDDYCPAVATNKVLSPKNIILNLRDGILEDQKDVLNKDRDDNRDLMVDVFEEDAIWACTTCMACMQVCPMKIEHVPKIAGLRQGQALMEGKFPSELKTFFNGLRSQGNPWGFNANTRMEWSEGLDVPRMEDKKDAEYLLYLGCAVSFDDRSKKIARSLVKVLNHLDISYAVLGNQEKCCGETARRLGEEAVGQELMYYNLEMLDKYNVKKIITPCPHCFNTFANEYPALDGNYEVIHHTQLVSELINDGRLKIEKEAKEKIVIHDSCYLGRGNDIYGPPREILSAIPGVEVVEPEMTKDHSMCCGAGGGMFWLEEKGDRVNGARANQLAETNADVIASSCPYCTRMLTDGVNNENLGEIEPKDLIEIIEENLITEGK